MLTKLLRVPVANHKKVASQGAAAILISLSAAPAGAAIGPNAAALLCELAATAAARSTAVRARALGERMCSLSTSAAARLRPPRRAVFLGGSSGTTSSGIQ